MAALFATSWNGTTIPRRCALPRTPETAHFTPFNYRIQVKDNQIFLSGIESYDAPREETLINVNFCASFRKGIYFMKKPAGGVLRFAGAPC